MSLFLPGLGPRAVDPTVYSSKCVVPRPSAGSMLILCAGGVLLANAVAVLSEDRFLARGMRRKLLHFSNSITQMLSACNSWLDVRARGTAVLVERRRVASRVAQSA